MAKILRTSSRKGSSFWCPCCSVVSSFSSAGSANNGLRTNTTTSPVVLFTWFLISTECKISLILNYDNYRCSIETTPHFNLDIRGYSLHMKIHVFAVQWKEIEFVYDSIYNKLYYLWLGKQFRHCLIIITTILGMWPLFLFSVLLFLWISVFLCIAGPELIDARNISTRYAKNIESHN